MFSSRVVTPSADIHLVDSLTEAATPSGLTLSSTAGLGPICHVSALNATDHGSRTLLC